MNKSKAKIVMWNGVNKDFLIEVTVEARSRDVKSAESQARLAMVTNLEMIPHETLRWRADSIVWLDKRTFNDWCPSCADQGIDYQGECISGEKNRYCGNCEFEWNNDKAENYVISEMYAPCCGLVGHEDYTIIVELVNAPKYVGHSHECWNCDKRLAVSDDDVLVVVGDL